MLTQILLFIACVGYLAYGQLCFEKAKELEKSGWDLEKYSKPVWMLFWLPMMLLSLAATPNAMANLKLIWTQSVAQGKLKARREWFKRGGHVKNLRRTISRINRLTKLIPTLVEHTQPDGQKLECWTWSNEFASIGVVMGHNGTEALFSVGVLDHKVPTVNPAPDQVTKVFSVEQLERVKISTVMKTVKIFRSQVSLAV